MDVNACRNQIKNAGIPFVVSVLAMVIEAHCFQVEHVLADQVAMALQPVF
jgi:hypothetical protein